MNWKILEADEWRRATFNKGIMLGNDCYLLRNDKSGIFCWSTINDKIELLHLEEKITFTHAYGSCVRVGEKVYCIPCSSEHILEYDIRSKSWERYKVDVDMSKAKYPAKFYAGFIYENNICLVPKSSPVIGLFDINRKKVQYFPEFFDIVSPYIDESWGHIEREEVFAFGSVWMLLWDSNVVVEFNMTTHEIKVHKVRDEGEILRNIEFDGEFIWFANQYGDIFRWNVVDDSKGLIRKGLKGEEIKFKIIGGEIWIFPFNSNHYQIMNVASGKLQKHEIVEIDLKFKDYRLDYYANGYLYLFPYNVDDCVVEIDLKTRSHRRVVLKVSDDDLYQYRKVFLRHIGYIYELDGDLSEMFNFLVNCAVDYRITSKSSVGSDIYLKIIRR